MSRHVHPLSAAGSPGVLTLEQADRVRAALRAAAGEHTDVDLGGEELEERIMPGLMATN